MQPLIIVLVLAIAIVILLVWVILLELRLKKIFRGKDASSLESMLVKNQKEIEELFRSRSEIGEDLLDLDRRLQSKITTARTLRFNPFQGTGSGGNQSFATAFLDEQGNGVVLSSLYSREKVSIFAKPIKNGTSEFDLTEEEVSVLKNDQKA